MSRRVAVNRVWQVEDGDMANGTAFSTHTVTDGDVLVTPAAMPNPACGGTALSGKSAILSFATKEFQRYTETVSSDPRDRMTRKRFESATGNGRPSTRAKPKAPLGKARRVNHPSQILPAAHGVAVGLRSGQAIRIDNIHGTQVVDTWALSAHDPLEYASMEHTRSWNSSVFVEAGAVVVSIRRRPMLTMVADTSPGRHDTQLCPCSSELYGQLGCQALHRSCTGNFHEALARLEVKLPFTPASLNLFMNVPIAADGSITRKPPASRAGDSVTLRAEMDVIVVLSACPQDITTINGADRTPRDIAFAVLATPQSGNSDE